MRRAQTDSGSQPVRNLTLNPRWETAGSFSTIRTNYCLNPRFVGSNFGGYGGQTLTNVTGLVGNPDGITTGLRVGYTAGASNPGGLVLVSPDLNTYYTFSAWVYNEGTAVENVAFAQKSVTSSPAIAMQPGVWTKVTWVGYVTHASLVNDIGIRIGITSAAGSFIMTGITAEKTVGLVGDFFDGATADTTDFTTLWQATANASPSSQRARAGVNVNTTGTGGKLLYQCSDRPVMGGKFMRMVSDTSASLGFNTTDCVVPAGVKRTNLFWLRTSRALNIQLRYRNTAGNAVSSTSAITTAANQWQLWRIADAPSVGDNQHLSLLIFNGEIAPGDVIDLGPHMVVEGVYQGDYLDGTSPFSKWDETADSSTSVGYPPQLLDIAGKPAIDIVGVGDTGALSVDPYAARTLYFVYESIDPNAASWQVPWYYGVAATAGLTFQTNAAGNDTMAPRLDFPNGTVNRTFTGVTRGTARRNVFAITFPQGLGQAVVNNAGGNDFTVSYSSAGDGWANGRLYSVARVGIMPVRGLVYMAEHDRATRIAISKYLGNKHGAYV